MIPKIQTGNSWWDAKWYLLLPVSNEHAGFSWASLLRVMPQTEVTAEQGAKPQAFQGRPYFRLITTQGPRLRLADSATACAALGRGQGSLRASTRCRFCWSRFHTIKGPPSPLPSYTRARTLTVLSLLHKNWGSKLQTLLWSDKKKTYMYVYARLGHCAVP